MLKKIIIAAAVLTVSLSALANTDLPLNGTRHFNFLGGSGTNETIDIRKDGHTVIKTHGLYGSYVTYDGPYQKYMPLDGGGYYGFIGVDSIASFDENGELRYGCRGNVTDPCVQKLY